jgi:signal transduction histidine kinase
MSHAPRTPLNTIIGFAERMLMRDVEQMAADQRGYITDIRNSGAPGAHQRHPRLLDARGRSPPAQRDRVRSETVPA